MRCIDHYIDLEVDSESCCSKCEIQRARFMAEISLFPSADQLVFVDETEFVFDTQYIERMQISL